ncbi:MAG: Holliday junction resolvase RuvX [Clostridia bacterium]
MAYSRKMGIDYGDARIGIAFTDLLNIICSPYDTIKTTTLEENTTFLASLIQEKDVDTVVIGLPLNMDGSEGNRAIKTRVFGDALKAKTKVPVVYWDERLSSCEAEDILFESDMNWRKKKGIIDKIAASIILESWLASNKKG